MKCRVAALMWLAVLTACSAVPPLPEPAADHPASEAAEVPDSPKRDYLLKTGAEAAPSHPQNLPVRSEPTKSGGHQMKMPMGGKVEGK